MTLILDQNDEAKHACAGFAGCASRAKFKHGGLYFCEPCFRRQPKAPESTAYAQRTPTRIAGKIVGLRLWLRRHDSPIARSLLAYWEGQR